MTFSSGWLHTGMDFSPCDYAFMVEKGFYTFRTADLHMNGTRTTMPVRLDWAIRDVNGSSMPMSCAQAASKPGYTCKSNHSECVDSTNGPGYVCNCTIGYEGNPYLSNGCTSKASSTINVFYVLYTNLTYNKSKSFFFARHSRVHTHI